MSKHRSGKGKHTKGKQPKKLSPQECPHTKTTESTDDHGVITKKCTCGMSWIIGSKPGS